jgi:gamma-polyglutamate biosynthesis protein CapC
MQLPIFPPHALDSSVITTVWVGLCVIAFLNLRFGTTMAGLVVPGYLVPMLLVKPMAAVVILGEALVTYTLVRLVADLWMRACGANELFGRDRYFAILLMSVLVRVAGDQWCLPLLGEWLQAHGVRLDWRTNLHSFGLVIVALTANQFWNGGVRRGLASFGLYVGLTWLLVRWVLVPFTNFDISGLNFVYEDLAANILDSPKAYMIILASALFASRLNLNFGWDFSGIMVPALIALLWYEPWRLVTTGAETIIVYLLGRSALKLPVFRRMNMEGSRLLLLFATVAYLYKIAVGFALGAVAPEYKPTDFFAFGYLISSLLAVKMHGKQLTWQLGATTLSASAAGLVIANLVGLALSLSDAPPTVDSVQPRVATDAASPGFVARIGELRRDFYRLQSGEPEADRLFDGDALIDGLRQLRRYRDERAPAVLEQASRSLAGAGYALEHKDDWLIVVDRMQGRGSGLYAVNLAPRTGILVSVPAPLDEPGALEAAARLADSGGHAMLAAAGMRMSRLSDGRSDPLTELRLPFVRAHAFADDGVLMVRGADTQPRQPGQARLWALGGLPASMSTAWLRSELGEFDVRWGRRNAGNRLRDASPVPFAELMLDRGARLRLLARGQRDNPYRATSGAQRIEGFLFEWLIRQKGAIAEAGSGRSQAAALGDLLYFQEEVIAPILAVAAAWDRKRDEDALRAIAASASNLGYQLILYRQRDTGETHLILTEPHQGGSRFWGTYVFRMGAASAYTVEIPRPLEELHSFEYGTALYSQVRARSLLIAGAHAAARDDGIADVLAPGNRTTLFNAVHQALLLGGDRRWFLQVRGKADRNTEAPDVIAAFAGLPPSVQERAALHRLLRPLQQTEGRVAVAGSDADSSLYRAGIDPQASAMRDLQQHRFVTLWVAPSLRQAYRSPLGGDPDAALFADLGIATETVELAARLRARSGERIPSAEDRSRVDSFVASRNLALLLDVQRRGWKLHRVIDPSTGESLLEMRDTAGKPVAVRSLDPGASGIVAFTPGRDGDTDEIARRFLANRSAWLLPADAR